MTLRGTSLGVKEVPQITWIYWETIRLMREYPGMYHLDEKRTKEHDELCEYYKIDKEVSRKVTDNLDKYVDAVDMHYALKKIKSEMFEK